jgi:hypothetical protein
MQSLPTNFRKKPVVLGIMIYINAYNAILKDSKKPWMVRVIFATIIVQVVKKEWEI